MFETLVNATASANANNALRFFYAPFNSNQITFFRFLPKTRVMNGDIISRFLTWRRFWMQQMSYDFLLTYPHVYPPNTHHIASVTGWNGETLIFGSANIEISQTAYTSRRLNRWITKITEHKCIANISMYVNWNTKRIRTAAEEEERSKKKNCKVNENKVRKLLQKNGICNPLPPFRLIHSDEAMQNEMRNSCTRFTGLPVSGR